MDTSERGVEMRMISTHGDSHKGMKVTFKNVTYTVPSNTEKGKVAALLSNVSGYFIPGRLSALMGPSGSGKTTLLDVLAGRKTQGEIAGSIHFASYPPTSRFLRRYTGYVEQFDTLLETMTVREMLLYTAELKRPMSETYDSKAASVDALLEKLALADCRDVIIGSRLNRGISGGQAKRVNIGIALISNPLVLFLDEPTSGLDSYTANEVMTVIKGLARDGTTLCTTIHSPTPYTYSLIDTVMMLVAGHTVYYGSREAATGYFSSVVDQPKSAEENSEAEWITGIVVSAGRQREISHLADSYDKSSMKKAVEEVIDAVSIDDNFLTPEEFKEMSSSPATVTPFWFGLKTLLKYRSLKNLTSTKFLLPRIVARIPFVFFLSTIFAGIGNEFDPENAPNIAGVLFVWCSLPVFSAVGYLPNLILERPVFYRERSDGLYAVLTYLLAKIFDELVIAVGTSLVFGTILWFAVNFQGSFAVFAAVFCGNLITGVGLAYTIAAIAPTLDAATAMLPAYASTLILFSGFLIRKQDIPVYYRWYTNLSFVQYGLSALLANAFDVDAAKNLNLQTRENGIVKQVSVLEYYDVDDVDTGLYAAVIYLFFLGFLSLAFLAMSCVKHQKR